MDVMKAAAAKEIGPGGIGCICCRPGKRPMTRKEARVVVNRVARRALKRELAKEAASADAP